MRSKISKKILNETPPEVREKVREYGKKRASTLPKWVTNTPLGSKEN